MKLTDLFRKKKPQPSVGQPADVLTDPGTISPQMQTQAGAPEQKISVEQLKVTLQQQKNKVQELKTVILEYKESVKSVHDASKQLDEQEKTLLQQEKEQAKLLTDPRVLPKSKQDVKQNLKKIREWLFDIKEARSTNKASLKQLNDAIRQNERAIKVNERAVRENERALKIISESKEGQQFDIKAKGIEDLMKDMMPETKLSPPARGGVVDPEAGESGVVGVEPRKHSPTSPQVIIPPTCPTARGIEASGFGKMKEGDYWEKGKM